MLETVVKPAVCHAGAKHSTGSTLKYSTCDMNPCPAFRTTSGMTSSRKLASVKTSRWKIEDFFSSSRHLRVLSANHVDSSDRKKVCRVYLAMTLHAQPRAGASILGKAADNTRVIEEFAGAKTTSSGEAVFFVESGASIGRCTFECGKKNK